MRSLTSGTATRLAACALVVAWAVPAGAVLCAKKKGAVVERTACRKKEQAVSLDQVGPPGAQGDPGAAGDSGAPGTPGTDGATGRDGVADTPEQVRAKFFAGTACPPDADLAGTACVDRYEASLWQVDPADAALVAEIRAGTATLADLTAAGATQLTPAGTCTPAVPATFPLDGNWTPVAGSDPLSPGVYALSIPGVVPAACTSWFQANQACQLSGKRLPTNYEWQVAATGTPDPGDAPGADDCNTTGPDPSNGGSRANCRSHSGAFDMVGNVWEWVGDWKDLAIAGTDWTSGAKIPGGDWSFFGGPGDPNFTNPERNIPGALLRGGNWTFGTLDGVFAVFAGHPPSASFGDVGFRCAR